MPPTLALGIHLSSLEAEGWDIEQCLAWANRMKIHCFEAGPALPAECRNAARMRRLAEAHGMTFAAFDVSGPAPPAEFEWAAEAGCRQIVLGGLELDDAGGCCAEIAAAAERSGVAASVDLRDGVASRAEELRRILDGIDSPWLRVAIDTGHAISAGCDPLELAAAFEGRIGHFRIRTGPGKCGEPLLRSVIELLLDGDYHGGLGVLDEGGRAPALAARVAEVRRTLELSISNSM